MKKLTILLRSAFVVPCCLCGMFAANASTEIPTVVATGGETNDAICCTIGETFVGDNTGLWENAVGISSGINAIYADGDVIVENSAADGSLKVQLSDELLAGGAFYNVYTVSGMLLESNRIDASPYVLAYDHLLDGQYIIITINTPAGVVATYKLSK